MENFVEDNGSNHLNIIFNELIENFVQMKLKNQKQSDIRFFPYVFFQYTYETGLQMTIFAESFNLTLDVLYNGSTYELFSQIALYIALSSKKKL